MKSTLLCGSFIYEIEINRRLLMENKTHGEGSYKTFDMSSSRSKYASFFQLTADALQSLE